MLKGIMAQGAGRLSGIPDIQQDELKRSRRKRMLMKAIVSFNRGYCSRECVVRDLSHSGAKLEFEDTADLPANFVLLIASAGLKVSCKKVRLVGNTAAVTFNGDVEQTKPAGKQVITPSFDPATKLMDREAELKQTIANMRRDAVLRHNNPEFSAPAPSTGKTAKSFGKRK